MVDFFLDGVLYDSPKGWEDTSVSIEFSHETQITSLDYTQEYEFTGAAYQYLYGKYKAGAYCDLVGVIVKRDNRTIVNGVIFITSCTFNESRCVVSAKIEDDGYSARIQNNLSVKVAANGSLSKNGAAITPIPVIDLLMFYSDGVYLNNARRGYFVHDMFRWYIDWMTDGIVGFRSDFFNVGGEGEVDTCSSGINLRDVGGLTESAPLVDFRTLFTTYRVLRNVAMGFQRVSGQVIVRIEHIDFFTTNPNTVTMSDINEVELSFVQELLYSNVKVGTDITRVIDCDSGNTPCTAFEETTYYGFDRESFGLTGTCNLDLSLDLSMQRDVVTDSNTIEDIVNFENDQYDEDLVCIQVNVPALNAPPQFVGYYQADQSDPLNIQQAWYNNEYRNESVLLRYVDYLNGSLGGFQLINGLNLFLVGGSSPLGRMAPSIDYSLTLANTPLWTPFPPVDGIIFFNDTAFIQNAGSVVPRIIDGFQSYDSGGQYDDATGIYTAQFDGAYRFSMQFSIQATSGSPAGQVTYRMNVKRYDSGGTLIQTVTSQLVATNTIDLTGVFYPTIIFDTGFIQGNAGEYFTANFEANTSNPFATDLQVLDGWFECVDTRSVITTIQTNTGSKNLGVRRSFNYPISCEMSDAIMDDVTTQILITGVNTIKQGFIEKAQINLITGESSFDIITNE